MPTGKGTYGKQKGRPSKRASTGKKPRGGYSPGSPKPRRRK